MGHEDKCRCCAKVMFGRSATSLSAFNQHVKKYRVGLCELAKINLLSETAALFRRTQYSAVRTSCVRKPANSARPTSCAGRLVEGVRKKVLRPSVSQHELVLR